MIKYYKAFINALKMKIDLPVHKLNIFSASSCEKNERYIFMNVFHCVELKEANSH